MAISFLRCYSPNEVQLPLLLVGYCLKKLLRLYQTKMLHTRISIFITQWNLVVLLKMLDANKYKRKLILYLVIIIVFYAIFHLSIRIQGKHFWNVQNEFISNDTISKSK